MKAAENKIPIKKNQQIEIVIDDLNSDGQGVGKVNGFAVFVVGALPGETVLAHIIKVRPSFAVAKLIEIIAPSPDRVSPRCPVHGKCGGCGLQHASYELQKRVKRKRVADAFARIGGFDDIRVEDVYGMDDPWRYRNKGAFPVQMNDEGYVVSGLYSRHSNTLVETFDCVIQDEKNVQVMRVAVEWANRYHIPERLLRHVVARVSAYGEVMACVVCAGRGVPHLDKLARMMESGVPGIASVLLNIQNKPGNVILGKEEITVSGRPYIRDRVGGADIRVSLQSFLQVNSAQREALYGFALELAGTGRCAADLYCGIGGLTLALAKRFNRVYGVECVESAAADANFAAERNGVDNASFILGRAEDEWERVMDITGTPDAIMLNPPRKGCDERLLEKLNADRIVYISCNPATLARDCAVLRGRGYAITAVQPVDMFPQTPHVETVVGMRRTGL